MVHDWTSHAPENQEKKEKTAAISHKPINPGSGYTLNPLQQTSRLGQEAQAEQGQKRGQQKQPSSSLSSKAVPVLEAVAGTALAFVVELMRSSRKKKTRKPAA
jgi:hypothetical protein